MRNERVMMICCECGKRQERVPALELACKCGGVLKVAKPKSPGRLSAAGRIGGNKRAKMGGSGIWMEGSR
jgi:hypothetical protein